MGRALHKASITHRDLTAPTSKAKPFNDPAWIWELKHDGYRALLIRDGERVSLQTRKGNELLQFFPEITADLRKLPDIAIDGELVMLDENGKPEFQQLRGRCAIRDPDRIGRAAADQLGLEGVIGKKADSPYRAGRTANWVKVKTAHGRHIDEERARWNE
jgi:ATP-dependent DNA ligase